MFGGRPMFIRIKQTRSSGWSVRTWPRRLEFQSPRGMLLSKALRFSLFSWLSCKWVPVIRLGRCPTINWCHVRGVWIIESGITSGHKPLRGPNKFTFCQVLITEIRKLQLLETEWTDTGHNTQQPDFESALVFNPKMCLKAYHALFKTISHGNLKWRVSDQMR